VVWCGAADKIPDHISYDEAAMVEPLAVGMHAATKAQIKPGDVAVVLGAGPIGMLQALAALAAGCAKVYISDVVAAKLAVAESLVAKGKIVGILADPKKPGAVKDAVLAATDGWGAGHGASFFFPARPVPSLPRLRFQAS
jgi:D-xylulose reductase